SLPTQNLTTGLPVCLLFSSPSLDSSMGDPSVPCPHIALSWPPDGSVTLEWIRRLTDILDWSSRNLPPSDLPTLLPSPVLLRILLAASDILHKEPNCVRVQADGDLSGVVVVGDVHGQLHDVLFLLEDAGFPGEDRLFVFNGDYVDRGAWGLETFVLLLAWKVSSFWPKLLPTYPFIIFSW
ncbi:hypothetical protein B296_00020808, partial [Ensete ventricosum]